MGHLVPALPHVGRHVLVYADIHKDMTAHMRECSHNQSERQYRINIKTMWVQ